MLLFVFIKFIKTKLTILLIKMPKKNTINIDSTSNKNIMKFIIKFYYKIIYIKGSLAQLVEQWAFNPFVEGSNPSRPIKISFK